MRGWGPTLDRSREPSGGTGRVLLPYLDSGPKPSVEVWSDTSVVGVGHRYDDPESVEGRDDLTFSFPLGSGRS